MDSVFGFSKDGMRRAVSAIRRTEGGDDSPGRPGAYRPGMILGVVAATVVSVQGTSHQARYTVRANHDANLVLTNQLPLDRPVSTDVSLQEGQTGDFATLVWRKQVNGNFYWSLLRVITEVPRVSACSSNASIGTGQAGVTTVAHPVRNFWQIHTLLYVTAFTKSVTSGTQTKLSQALYNLPAGYIHFFNGLTGINAKASAVGLTNNIRVGLGTTAASGSGTTLTAAESNVMASATLGPLTTSGVQGRSPLDGNVNADGTSSARVLYLNVCPTANWTATANITFDRHTAMSELMNFQWRNMGGIS